MPNIIDSIQLSGVTYTIQGSGGGKSVEAGRGIDVASGTSAYTVSFNLPISAGTGSNSIAEGYGTFAYGNYSHAEGYQTFINSSYSHAEGYLTTAAGNQSHAEGNFTIANNQSEHASGQYNVSNKANNTFGNSGNTLFSVGNGPAYNARHNAFEIRQNGDIYLSSGGTDIKLQDHLGGGNPTVELTQSAYDALVQAGTVDPNTYYIITDATPVDMSQYWTSAQTQSAITEATSGKVDTSAITSSVTSASTDSEIPTAKAVFDAIPTGGTGGGKAIEGGRGISVTTGETADTISLNEAISASTASSSTSIAIGSGAKAEAGYNAFLSNSGGIAIGSGATANRRDICIGNGAKGYSVAGSGLICIGLSSVSKQGGISIGNYSEAYGEGGFDQYGGISIGFLSKTQSRNAIAIGYNTVASGTTKTNINNQLKIDTSNQIYIKDKTNTNEVCLQDIIPSTTSAVTSGSTAVVESGAVYDQLGGMKIVKLTESEYTALVTKDESTLYVVVPDPSN